MSPEALHAALEAVEAELDAARSWERSALSSLGEARDLVERAAHGLQAARQRVEALEEALGHLEGLQQPQTAAQALEAPVGASIEDRFIAAALEGDEQ